MRSISLNLNQALALDKLAEFVRQEQVRGAELVMGSDFERALALLITQHRIRRPLEVRSALEHRCAMLGV